MKTASSGFLHGAGPAGHAVQLYRDLTELAEHVPLAQLALMWISSQMPRSAEQILESSRAHYLQEPAAQQQTG